MDWRGQVAQYEKFIAERKAQESGQENHQFGGGYLNAGGFDTTNPNANISWEDFVRQLGFSQLDNVTDFNSPLYQQYANYLNKTTPSMGMNGMLGMMMAGGTGYAGGQAIAGQKIKEFQGQRQDSMNNNVTAFAGQMQGQVPGLLGQIGGSFAGTMDRKLAQEQADAASSPWGVIGSGIGGLLGLGGSALMGGSKPNAGTGGGTAGYAPGYWNGGGNPMNPWMRK